MTEPPATGPHPAPTAQSSGGPARSTTPMRPKPVICVRKALRPATSPRCWESPAPPCIATSPRTAQPRRLTGRCCPTQRGLQRSPPFEWSRPSAGRYVRRHEQRRESPKSETQKSRAHEKHGLGSKASGRNIQAPPKREYTPASDGPAIPDPSKILAGKTYRSWKPSEWRVRPRRRGR
jgi:hypothetical protein